MCCVGRLVFIFEWFIGSQDYFKVRKNNLVIVKIKSLLIFVLTQMFTHDEKGVVLSSDVPSF